MFQETLAYHNARVAGNRPVFLAIITSSRAQRIYSDLMPTEAQIGSGGGLQLWNGTYLYGDGGIWGNPIISHWDARVLSWGSFSERLTPQNNALLQGFSQTEFPAWSVDLDNTDGFFSKILGDDQQETFLLQTLELRQAWATNTNLDFVTLYIGTITEISLSARKLTLISEPEITSGNALLTRTFGDTADLYAIKNIGGNAAGKTTLATTLAPVFFTDSWELIINFKLTLGGGPPP
jgi:hypothetical protein